jgi:hypothetical protein
LTAGRRATSRPNSRPRAVASTSFVKQSEELSSDENTGATMSGAVRTLVEGAGMAKLGKKLLDTH